MTQASIRVRAVRVGAVREQQLDRLEVVGRGGVVQRRPVVDPARLARASGSSAQPLMQRKTTYGQAATGNYIRMRFNRCSLGSALGLTDDPVLGQGRDPLAPLQDVMTRCWQASASAHPERDRGAMRTVALDRDATVHG